MNLLLETKRVHISMAIDFALKLVRLIRDFYFFEHDRNLIADLQYEIMMAGFSEESNIKSTMEKFNIKRDRHYFVDLKIFCTSRITKKLYEITNNSSHDRSLVKL